MNMQSIGVAPSGQMKLVAPETAPEVRTKWAAIDRINFGDIKRKLMLAKPEGSGFSAQVADNAIESYRQYLKLCAKYPDQCLVPSHFIDNVWHQHILDTRAYAGDCNAVFGGILHHNPYLGINGDADKRDDAFNRTAALFITEFGTSCNAGSGSICGGGQDERRAALDDSEVRH